MQQEVVLVMLANEPSHGYQLRARLRDGSFIDETRLTGGSRGDLGVLAGLGG